MRIRNRSQYYVSSTVGTDAACPASSGRKTARLARWLLMTGIGRETPMSVYYHCMNFLAYMLGLRRAA